MEIWRCIGIYIQLNRYTAVSYTYWCFCSSSNRSTSAAASADRCAGTAFDPFVLVMVVLLLLALRSFKSSFCAWSSEASALFCSCRPWICRFRCSSSRETSSLTPPPPLGEVDVDVDVTAARMLPLCCPRLNASISSLSRAWTSFSIDSRVVSRAWGKEESRGGGGGGVHGWRNAWRNGWRNGWMHTRMSVCFYCMSFTYLFVRQCLHKFLLQLLFFHIPLPQGLQELLHLYR